MGRIYRGQDRVQNRDVVIKLMSEQVSRRPKFRLQFQQELDCMRRLSHPGVVALLDGSLEDPSGPCLIMEHVRGQDMEFLRKRQPQRRFPAARLGRLMGQLCEVLQAAHDQGIVHRDLKPSNLMVVDWGLPLERIKVVDFGLAKWVEDFREPAEVAANRGRPSGSAGYISPEQIRGQSPDPRADLYSVGVILFELLTGRLPFRGSGVAETFEAHLREVPPRFNQVDPTLNVSPAVEAVVQLCLAKEPGARPLSARDLGQRLERALGQPILGVPPAAASNTSPAGSTPPSAPAVQRPKPTMPGTVAVQRPSRETYHDAPPPPQQNGETTCLVPGFRADPRSLNSIAGFVKQLGGRLVEKGPEGMRALVPVNLNGSLGSFASGGAGSGSVQLILTELEFRWEPRSQGQPLQLAFRSLSPVSLSLANAWRGGCERVQAQLQAHLQT
jgi:serine/threonine-protein kinase